MGSTLHHRLFDIVDHMAAPHLERIAYGYKHHGEWKTLSFAGLKQQAQKLALGLMERGLQPGDCVASISTNKPEWNVLDLAVMQAAGIHVSLFPTFSAENLKFTLSVTRSRFVFVSNLLLFQLVSDLLPELPSVEGVFILAGSGNDPYTSLFTENVKEAALQDLEQRKTGVQPHHVASIIFSSGTHARPKGVKISHQAMLFYARTHRDIYHLTDNDRALSALPVCHGYERSHIYYYQMLGIPAFYASSVNNLATVVLETRPTFITAVPMLVEQLHQALADEPAGAPIRKAAKNIRIIASSGASLPERHIDFFELLGIPVIESYGLTEGLGITSNRIDSRKTGTVGLPLPGVSVKLSEEGEILVKSPSVTTGYINPDEELPLTDDGWFRTGDAGQWVDDRFLKIVGRKKDIFKNRNGRYISPADLEKQLAGKGGVRFVLIVGAQQPHLGALIVAYDGATHQQVAQTIEEFNRGRTESEQIATFVVVNDEWTVENGAFTHSMKLRRHYLEQKYKEVIDDMFSQNG